VTTYPPPGRNPPDPSERLLVQTRRSFGGGNDGGSRWAQPVKNTDPIASPYVAGQIVYVFHGDDPTVERPDAVLVRWVGAAMPDNKILTDDYLNVTLTDEEIAGMFG